MTIVVVEVEDVVADSEGGDTVPSVVTVVPIEHAVAAIANATATESDLM
jgi:hypothetical protein